MAPTSSAACVRPPVQTELFGVVAATTPPTTTCPPCLTCGATTAVISSGSGPHWAALYCIRGHYQKWVPRPQGEVQ
jgi:hypothetical protein